MPEDVRIKFGNRLRQIRKEKSISQEQLALDCDIARSHMSGIERGVVNITLKSICRIAIVLGVKPSVLLTFPPTKTE